MSWKHILQLWMYMAVRRSELKYLIHLTKSYSQTNFAFSGLWLYKWGLQVHNFRRKNTDRKQRTFKVSALTRHTNDFQNSIYTLRQGKREMLSILAAWKQAEDLLYWSSTSFKMVSRHSVASKNRKITYILFLCSSVASSIFRKFKL